MGSIAGFFYEMMILYLIAFVGFIARKKSVLNNQANDVLTQLVLYITLPALIVFSLDMPFSSAILNDFLWLVGMSIYILAVSIYVAKWIGKKASLPSMQGNVFEGLIVFGNQGFIGYAVIYILFAEQGILYLTMFNICYLILIWTYGIHLFTKSNEAIDWKKILLNPGIAATMIGIIIFFLPVRLPAVAAQTLESIGKMTIPLSMMLIGSLLAEVKGNELSRLLKNKHLWKVSLARLFIIPACLFVFVLFPVSHSILVISVLASGMPSAPTVTLYAQKFGADSQFASVGVMFTTILCAFSLPLIYSFLYFL